ncbi:MAG: Nif3-like dinuclear metal center hexameric protein [Alphaproteobacteria bacterium]|nr:Nif3-like dinuclear metal center hexameric protein [Alphaproteobacteria bacterium]
MNKLLVKDIIEHLNGFAPFLLSEPYDNTGLIVGQVQDECKGIIICLDVTEFVIQEALESHSNVIISHHPIIFKPLAKLCNINHEENMVRLAIKNDLNIIAMHTNLDNVIHGVNAYFADRLQLINRKILSPKPHHHEFLNPENIGAGIVGYLPNPLDAPQFLDFLATSMESNIFKYSALPQQIIHKIAICGGAGSFLIPVAQQQNAHVFISSEFKHSDYFKSTPNFGIIDIGHFESEKYTINLLFDFFQKKIPIFANIKMIKNTNPVNYYIKNYIS